LERFRVTEAAFLPTFARRCRMAFRQHSHGRGASLRGVTASPSKIQHCANSTISEAWAVVIGLPGRIEDADVPLVARAARRTIGPDLTEKPAIVAVNAPKDLAAPFWSQQVTWGGERYLARFGHRYLSVHFRREQEDEPYDTYANTLQPQIATWLNIVAEGLDGAAAEYGVDRIGFGYVNRFAFSPDDFDVSRFFKLSLSFDVGSETAGALGLRTEFRLYDPTHTIYLIVQLTAEGPADEKSDISVTTRVLAEKRGLEGLTFADVLRVGENSLRPRRMRPRTPSLASPHRKRMPS
jgi:hypothetical protein